MINNIIIFHPAYKVVLSGLSEHSWGCGSYKKTVWHARLIDDYTSGRMERKKGDLLCAPLTRATFDVENASKEQLERGVKVNCKKCCEILSRTVKL